MKTFIITGLLFICCAVLLFFVVMFVVTISAILQIEPTINKEDYKKTINKLKEIQNKEIFNVEYDYFKVLGVTIKRELTDEPLCCPLKSVTYIEDGEEKEYVLNDKYTTAAYIYRSPDNKYHMTFEKINSDRTDNLYAPVLYVPERGNNS